MVWYEVAGRVLYYIALPVVSILILLFHILQAVLSPFVSIARGIFNICMTPYHIAAKFEVLSSSIFLDISNFPSHCGTTSVVRSSLA